jgi:peptidoglycan/xylan/chitin deacetylase (PgdA/CDA1 family)
MMLRHLARAVVCMAMALGMAGAAAAAEKPYLAGKQLAWFQKKNIFHDGLRGAHTVALTFDDGPNENTLSVLDALDRYGIKATFFIVGRMAQRHPDVLAEVARRGHLLANHTATHSQLGQRYANNPRLLLNQIRQVNDYIAPLMAQGDTLFFRAPYGYWKDAHARVLNNDRVLKHYVGPIYWDIGGQTRISARGYVLASADWDCWNRHWSAETCAKGYLREMDAKDGGVVLMHAIHAKSGALVDAVVPQLLREGYRFVRLDAVKEYDRYKTPPETPFVAFADRPERALR